jgi:hypothetical protein
MKPILLFVVLVSICVNGQVPKDFSLMYTYSTGAIAPPYYYKYNIVIKSDLTGNLALIKSYDDSVSWQKNFFINEKDIMKLYSLSQSIRVFSKQWYMRRDIMCGGSEHWLKAVANTDTVEMPSQLEDKDDEALIPIYKLMKELVPRDLWNELNKLTKNTH